MVLVGFPLGPALADFGVGSGEPNLQASHVSGAGDLRLGATQGEGQADIVDVHHAIQYLMREQPSAVRDLPYIPADMKTLIEAGSDSIRAVRNVYQTMTRLKAGAGFTEPGGAERVFHPATSVRLLCPIPNPSKIFGMAGNYAREGEPPEYPSAFLKSVSALVGHEEVIDLAGLVTVGVHEPEFALVIGKRARNVPEAQAFDYVVGYTIVNDITARDLPQGNHPAQGSAISKSLDTFAPCGPYLTLKEDVPDPHNLAIGARINGQAWEIPNANTRHLIFKIPQIIAYLSQRITLMPGDIIATRGSRSRRSLAGRRYGRDDHRETGNASQPGRGRAIDRYQDRATGGKGST